MGKTKNKNNGKKTQAKYHTTVDLKDITPDEENTFAAMVESAKGCGHFVVRLHKTGELVQTAIPGSFKKRVWVRIGDVVFIQLEPELSGANCFIRHVYTAGELQDLRIVFTVVDNNDDVTFTDVDIDDI